MDERKRAPNFTLEEVEKLKASVQKFASVVENRRSDVLSKKQKIEGWKKIEIDFNADNNNAIFRNHDVLKKKWENLKKCCKKKYSDMKTYRNQTAGGASKDCVFTPVEETVLEVLATQATGMIAEDDCDKEENIEIFSCLDSPKDNFSNNILLKEILPIDIQIDKDYGADINKLSANNDSENILISRPEIGNSDWSNSYKTKMLKNQLSKQLTLNKTNNRQNNTIKAPSETSKKCDDLKREFLIMQQTQFLKESELRIKLMKEEHKLKIRKLQLEIEELEKKLQK